MAVRFFMLQAHYRSTLDFSNDALDAAEKGYRRLMNAVGLLPKLKASKKSEVDMDAIRQRSYAAMNDDFNSPVLIAELFEVVRIINSIYDGKIQADTNTIGAISTYIKEFVFDILGLLEEQEGGDDDFAKLMDLVIDWRNEAKATKDYVTSDRIREGLTSMGVQLKDSKDGTLWNKI